ncbi:MAG: 3-phosphoshikimate 1-carboxyvinyltransferase, partial [Bacteroidota bacterium]|nr:3-phosphoshikimate 1-carboxyvinyltransferase [Bacteroidota bacterium]
SSQFVSALLLIAPKLPDGLTVHLQGSAVSVPYINMTIRLLSALGVHVIRDKSRIRIPESEIIPKDFTVEADWSAAAFWYEAAALSRSCDLLLPDLRKDSLQGDSIVSSIYSDFGVTTTFLDEGIRITSPGKLVSEFSFDFSDYPDIALPVITTCAALGIHGKFEGLKGLRLKESDRLKALKTELGKMGVVMELDRTGDQIRKIEIAPCTLKPTGDEPISTYGDHRIAMTFANMALKFGSVKLENPDVVTKSYPEYWNDLISIGFDVKE